jgi:hypothetical protein
MATRLYSPSIIVNNNPIMITINSFVYKDGFGEDIVTPVANGRNVELINSTNLETKKGMMSFSIPSTAENAELVKTWKGLYGSLVIRVSDPDSDFTRTLTSGTLITDPEIQLQNEGVIELEFEGNTLV